MIEKSIDWVTGEVNQGKVTVVIAFLLLIAVIFIFKYDNKLLKGSVIPVCLAITLLGGYGAFQIIQRPQHLENLKELVAKNPTQALQQEIDKSTTDSNAYKVSTKVWAGLAILCLIIGIVVSKEYYRGMAFGFTFLFFVALIGDTILKYRVDTYIRELSS